MTHKLVVDKDFMRLIPLALKKEELLKSLAKERQKLRGERKGKLMSKSSTAGEQSGEEKIL